MITGDEAASRTRLWKSSLDSAVLC